MRCLAFSCLVLFFLVWSMLFLSCLVLSSLVSSSLVTCPTCVLPRKIRGETHVSLFSGLVWSGRALSCLVSRWGLFSGLAWSLSATYLAQISHKNSLVCSSFVRSGQGLVKTSSKEAFGARERNRAARCRGGGDDPPYKDGSTLDAPPY